MTSDGPLAIVTYRRRESSHHDVAVIDIAAVTVSLGVSFAAAAVQLGLFLDGTLVLAATWGSSPQLRASSSAPVLEVGRLGHGIAHQLRQLRS
ncbi:hypothetical protein MCOR25_009381 [Pyricularia grisea]|uniref:Uncharacterized protein n=1 Tax=Pyricularia grisea TaxID=148305 RepID=A0A6P8AQQ3_PYRGI|nr:uncharacterized protein PgNI_12220 [Pyricularia grisea]KAI6352549.1 hypothetical protein MCOR25_009381 [Pyricularia grisea]TLD04379.1 hypothetical protein PgNI_12220 [Pyricularia grisea]